ncbi:MAG: MoxR family ATPase [Bacteroidales bacterium]|nr:MoxR family ATPase [Bacteroidales bacterium]MCF8334773.1 MoxR family ATPase [Bacteroidales bacterium]
MSEETQEEKFENRIDLEEFQQKTDAIRSEIKKVIVGQDSMIDLMLVALISDGHVLLEGVPGIAKTLTAKLMAKCVKAGFKRVQFTPDLLPSDLIGTSVYNTQKATFEFYKGPLFSNIVLVDEINRAPAKTQSALFEVMEERQITTDGKTHVLPPPFLVIATQNPIDLEGTYRLPEAQLDRFLFKIEVDYPKKGEESTMLEAFQEDQKKLTEESIDPVIDKSDLMRLRAVVSQVRVEKNILDYIVEIVEGTRNNPDLFLGASPRASLGTLISAKAYAVLNGRDFVIPDDVQFVAPHVLLHRIILSPDREMEGISPEEIIKQIIADIKIPR